MEHVIELKNICKYFGDIKANDNVNISLKKGEIHAILGENGAGKSTLMSILFGLYTPDSGEIKVNGKVVNISNPNVAKKLGIGMVHQHFKLIDNFTVVDNIMLGDEDSNFGILNRKKVRKKIVKLADKYGLNIDPDAKIQDVTVGQQQRVEILKMLYRDAEILIFDEPTAVLTPQEIEGLMEIMKNLVKEGKSILLISHKLNEVKYVADVFSVLRKGKYIGTKNVADATEKDMASMMVGREINFETPKDDANPQDVILDVKNLVVQGENKNVVDDVSFNVRAGEIHGIIGIEGNGQTDLVYAITGMKKISSGSVFLKDKDITNLKIKERLDSGIAHIPEDRHRHGLVLEFSLEDNLVLHKYMNEPYCNKYKFLNREAISKNAKKLVLDYDIRSANGIKSVVRQMSGGNQQKAIIARELEGSPELLIAVQPTRGLDIGAIESIRKRLVDERDKGKAVLLISLEVDEVLDICDRISVIYEGKFTGEVDPKQTTVKEIGLYMSGYHGGDKDE